MKARIIRSSKREFTCLNQEGETIIAQALGNLLKKGQIVVGDFVEISTKQDHFIIESVYERKSEVYRIIPRERKKKVTASNVDLLLIVTSVSKPEYKQGIIDRYLLRAQQWDIPAVVIFNKMDEFQHQVDLSFEAQRIKNLNIDCFEVSATTEHKNSVLTLGFQELRERMLHQTALLLGQSGVGKSKLITKLSNGLVNLESRELAKVGKGAHTTTWAELIDCGDFSLIDSPGVRSFSLDDLDTEDLLSLFPDLLSYIQKCKFNNCRHLPESTGCFFQTLDNSQEETQLVLSRLESLIRFTEEIGQRESWEKNY